MIQQGDEGDLLYVVEQGKLNCFVRIQGAEKLVKVYGEGESFGELALLYNAPRAASIVADSECILFALDRDCFNRIVKQAAVTKRQRYEQFLDQVDLLKSIDPYEKQLIADGLITRKWKKGDYITQQVDFFAFFFCNFAKNLELFF